MLSKHQAFIVLQIAGWFTHPECSRHRQKATGPNAPSSPTALTWCEEPRFVSRGRVKTGGGEFYILGSVSWMTFPLLLESFAELYGKGMSEARNKEGLVPRGSVQGSVPSRRWRAAWRTLSVMGPPLRGDSDLGQRRVPSPGGG